MSCLMAGISKLEFYDGKIFVLDKMHSARLYVFGTQGEYKFDWEKRAGLMNICKLMIFSIDKEKNLIYVLCDKKNSLLILCLDSLLRTNSRFLC